MNNIPSLYQPGSHLNIRLDGISHTITVVVEKAITPFTSSQVLVVHALSPLPSPLLPPGTPMILKVYDTRYLKDREDDCSSDLFKVMRDAGPWLLDNELKATAYREAHIDWKDTDPFLVEGLDKAMMFELRFYFFALKMWIHEVDAYHTLVNSPLSGSNVPIFYGSGDLILDELRGFVPGVLLLEYIPHAMTLAEVKDINTLTPWHIQTLIATVSKLNDLGVSHDDINLGNILISPERAVIIDFGSSKTRVQDGVDRCSDVEWKCELENSLDVYWMKRVLDHVRGIGPHANLT